jgi:hypothetical protein
MQLTSEQNAIISRAEYLDVYADLHIDAEINKAVCDLHPHKLLSCKEWPSFKNAVPASGPVIRK